MGKIHYNAALREHGRHMLIRCAQELLSLMQSITGELTASETRKVRDAIKLLESAIPMAAAPAPPPKEAIQ